MWYDADIDAVMTPHRQAAPSRRAASCRSEALAFGITLSGFSVVVLGPGRQLRSRPALLAFTIFFYAVIYTMWLKRWTPQNIVIGGAAGAFPPMIGWAAVTGGVSIESIMLFLIIFLWTPAHFWALALFKMRDYGAVGVPMLPNVAGEKVTKDQILIYAVLTAPVGVAPAVLGFAGAGLRRGRRRAGRRLHLVLDPRSPDAATATRRMGAGQEALRLLASSICSRIFSGLMIDHSIAMSADVDGNEGRPLIWSNRIDLTDAQRKSRRNRNYRDRRSRSARSWSSSTWSRSSRWLRDGSMSVNATTRPQASTAATSASVAPAASSSPAWSGMAYAAVPLYDMFCRVTGYNGTTQRVEQALVRDPRPEDHASSFDTNMARAELGVQGARARRRAQGSARTRRSIFTQHQPVRRGRRPAGRCSTSRR